MTGRSARDIVGRDGPIRVDDGGTLWVEGRAAADLAEAYGYVNRSLPDATLDDFVDALATRIASFDKWAIANTKRLVNAASLPPDVEIAAGWDACMASITRAAAQQRIRALFDRGFQKPGDVENRLGFSVGHLVA